MNLDKRDYDILAILALEARTPAAQIARSIRTSREVVDYRIKRLVRRGIVKEFCTEIDPMALGYTKHVMYVDLKNVNKEREEELIEEIKKNRYINWFALVTGRWSFIFDVHTKNHRHLVQLIEEIKDILRGHLADYVLVTLQRYHSYYGKFFGKQTQRTPLTTYKLDKIDKHILKHLRNDARKEYVEIAKTTDITPEAISKRVRNLRKQGVIKRFYTYIDKTKIGYEYYNIQITLENTNKIEEQRIHAYLEQHPLVAYFYKSLSRWDVEFGVFVKSAEELREFTQELRTAWPNNVRIRLVQRFYDEVKTTALPEGLFD